MIRDARKITVWGILIITFIASCGPSRSEQISAQIKAIREESNLAGAIEKDTNNSLNADAAAGTQNKQYNNTETRPKDPVRLTRKDALELEVSRRAELVRRARESDEPNDLAMAVISLEKAKKDLAAELKRQKQIADLRARTPNRIIDPQSESRPSVSPHPNHIITINKSAEPPAVAPRDSPENVQGTDLTISQKLKKRDFELLPDDAAPDPTVPESRPVRDIINNNEAEKPASKPVMDSDSQLAAVTRRIQWLASLRASAGDHAGAIRLRQRAANWRLEYEKGNKQRALDELTKIVASADN